VIIETELDSNGTPQKWYVIENTDGTEAFAARIVGDSGAKRVEIAWTQSLRLTSSWLAQVQQIELPTGQIDQIVGKASNGLERAMTSGKIGGLHISRRLERALGGSWTVKIATSNGIVSIIAERSRA
jgi:hypothetical protein